ncbi:MAG: polymer-forming cytoskeletal protein [Treponema sp.]|jgi:cytoskeletal protein CcmA (bactofilin family)|nr:polymer-forming cytoskeletal protein [Treponema sp.]
MKGGKRGDFSINTMIGPGTSVNGDVDSAGFTRVDGNLRGDLDVKGRIVVGEQARMKGNVSGSAVTVGGVICGNVLAGEYLVVLSTGIVLGDIITRRIQADEGCLIHGRITVCSTHDKWDSAVREHLDKEDVKSVTAAFASSHSLPPPPSSSVLPLSFPLSAVSTEESSLGDKVAAEALPPPAGADEEHGKS